ncbi:hypothetical protein ACFLT7_00010 [candidate division KSB1 bacterium]
MRKTIVLLSMMLLVLSMTPAPMAADQASVGTGPVPTDKLGPWDWGHLRIVRTGSNMELLTRLRGTVNQTGRSLVYPRERGRDGGGFITDKAVLDQRIADARENVKKFHDQGIHVIAYMTMGLSGESEKYEDTPLPEQISINAAYNEPGLWGLLSEYYGPKPPEGPSHWARHTHDGRYSNYRFRHPNAERTGGRFEMFGCQDNPSYMQYISGVVRSIADGGHDGCYIDWTKVHGGTCYCEHSKRAFRQYLNEKVSFDYLRKRYGITSLANIEPPIDNTGALWREWLKFRSWSLAESHRILRAAAREINPNFLFSGNINGGAYGNQAYTNGDDMELMGEVDDFLYSEIQYGIESVPRVEGETKIANSGPLKFLAAAAMQKPVWMYCIQPSHPKPIAHEPALFNLIKLNIAEAYASHNTFSVVRETFGKPISHFVHDGAEQIYKFMEENEPNAVGAKLAANVGIFCSINQFYSDEYSYFNPASRVLADNGIAHVMTVERDFSPAELAKYKVLVLPYVPLMSDSQAETIGSWVNDGGGLVVMGMCSSLDENGLRRTDLGLKEVLGFGLKDDIPGQVTKKSYGKGRVVYIPLNPLLVGRGDTRRSPLANDHMMYGQGKFPSQVKGSFESLADAVQWAADGDLSGKMTGSAMVELSTMEQKDKGVVLAHLVNYNVDLKGKVKPAGKVKATIMVPPGKKIAKVTVGSPTWATKEIKYSEKSGNQNKHIEFSIPEFDIYSLATIYYE